MRRRSTLPCELEEDGLTQLFQQFDIDGSGTISLDELSLAVKQAGLHLSREQVMELVQQVDADQSGDLDLAEFTQLMQLADERLVRVATALRDSYLDQKAREAGAESNEWYTSEMLLAREQLKTDPAVEAALQAAWAKILPSLRAATMGRDEYVVMYRLIYLLLKSRAGEKDFDPADCMSALEEDWQEDSGGKGFLDFADFRRSWFQLADLNVDGVDASDYAVWILILGGAVTTSEGAFRPDADLLEYFRHRCKKRKFRERCASWAAAFCLGGDEAAALEPVRLSRDCVSEEVGGERSSIHQDIAPPARAPSGLPPLTRTSPRVRSLSMEATPLPSMPVPAARLAPAPRADPPPLPRCTHASGPTLSGGSGATRSTGRRTFGPASASSAPEATRARRTNPDLAALDAYLYPIDRYSPRGLLPPIGGQRPQGMRSRVPEGDPDGMTNGMPNGMPSGMPNGMPNGMPKGASRLATAQREGGDSLPPAEEAHPPCCPCCACRGGELIRAKGRRVGGFVLRAEASAPHSRDAHPQQTVSERQGSDEMLPGVMVVTRSSMRRRAST